MPRDSSGNYTLPLGNPVIDGTIIDTNWANPTMSDIAVQLNNVVTRDGLLGFTSEAYFVDGTPALPGIAFASQHGTGLWKDSTQVGISYQGVAQQIWNAAGTTIAGNLTVTGTGPYVKKTGDTMTGPLILNSGLALAGPAPLAPAMPPGVFSFETPISRAYVGDGSGYSFRFSGRVGGTTADLLTILDTGNVGVGTSFPAAASGLAFAIFNSSAGQARIAIKNTVTGDAAGDGLQLGVDNAGEAFIDQREDAAIRFTTNATERMRIDAAGNVGIGMLPISAGFRMSVLGPVGLKGLTTSGIFQYYYSNTDVLVAQHGYEGVAASENFTILTRTAIPLTFGTNNTERMRIAANGAISSVGPLTLGPTPFAGSSSRLQLTYNTTIEHCIGIKPNTDVGPGNAIIFYNNAGTQVGGITTSGTNTAYVTSSDARLKSSIVAVQDVGHIIDALFVREFEFRSEPGTKRIGFIAQELVKAVPEAVHKGGENPDTHPWGVDTSPVIPLLVREIQSLRARLTAGGL